MKKILLPLLFAFVATVLNAENINYSTELLYDSSGDGLMVVHQIVNSDGSVTIGDYQGDMVIPETVNGVKVVAIDNGAFKNCTELTGISIPGSVVYSGSGAFYGCTSLKKLRLEDSDEEIIFIDEEEPYVTVRYWEQAALEEVYVGRNFRHQNKKGEPGIPFGEPFSHHSSIKSVSFGNKVTRINEGAFGWIPNLTSVAFGTGLVTIEKDAFQGSEQLASRLHFPKSLKFIGEYAFYGTSIPEIVIPNSVDEICDYALSISTLKNVVFEDGEHPIKLGAGNMDGVAPGPFGTAMFSSGGGQPLEEAYIGRPVESQWPDLFHGNATIKKVTLGKHAIGLSNSYFEFCTSLETVVLGENINQIGDLAFFGCAKLKNVNLPEGITFIGHSAFTGCESLTDIKLPSTLTHIGDYSFTNMGLTKIVIPKSVEEIGVEGVSNWLLKEIVIEDSTTPLTMRHPDDASVFMNCKKLENAYVGRDINTDAFHGSESLKAITFGNDVTAVHASFCEGCPLERLILGSSVAQIGEYAFSAFWEESAKLNTIYCYATTPPVCADSNVFNNINKTTCKLYVPEESIDAYKVANVWKEFLNIASGINSITKASSSDVIYDLQGRRMIDGGKGLYIVGGKKMLVK